MCVTRKYNLKHWNIENFQVLLSGPKTRQTLTLKIKNKKTWIFQYGMIMWLKYIIHLSLQDLTRHLLQGYEQRALNKYSSSSNRISTFKYGIIAGSLSPLIRSAFCQLKTISTTFSILNCICITEEIPIDSLWQLNDYVYVLFFKTKKYFCKYNTYNAYGKFYK